MLCGMADHTATPKARNLGAALRDARNGKKLTLRELGTALDLDFSKLGKYERGELIPSDVIVAKILTYCGVGGKRYDEILAMTKGTDAPQWLAVTVPEQRQHLDTLISFERNAATIYEIAPTLIPGLLQTDDYSREVFTGGGAPSDDLHTKVAIRMGRQQVLQRRPNPVRFVALIGQAAVRQILGSDDIMIAQLEHLLEISKRENVDIRIMSTRGWHPGVEGQCTVIEPMPAPDAFSVVCLDNRRSGLILHQEEDVAAYRQDVDAVLRTAMSPTDSVRLIAAVIKEMRTG